MIMHVKIPDSLSRFLDAVKAAGRRNLFSVAANALKIDVQQYLMGIAARRHTSAQRLGAPPTGHLEKGAARITFSADESHGEVVIPIAGMNRAFDDVTITPRHAGALTLPVNASAYGHRAAELARMGWHIFRPKGHDVLMGTRAFRGNAPTGEPPVTLYVLKKRVQQRQDRSLLPSDEQINSTVARAMMGEIRRVAKLAG